MVQTKGVAVFIRHDFCTEMFSWKRKPILRKKPPQKKSRVTLSEKLLIPGKN